MADETNALASTAVEAKLAELKGKLAAAVNPGTSDLPYHTAETEKIAQQRAADLAKAAK